MANCPIFLSVRIMPVVSGGGYLDLLPQGASWTTHIELRKFQEYSDSDQRYD